MRGICFVHVDIRSLLIQTRYARVVHAHASAGRVAVLLLVTTAGEPDSTCRSFLQPTVR